MYYKATITRTARSINNKQEKYQVFDNEHKTFKTLQGVKNFLDNVYGKSKLVKIYRDIGKGNSQHVGYIYCFKNEDISHIPIKKWYQQDWIEITEVFEKTIIIR